MCLGPSLCSTLRFRFLVLTLSVQRDPAALGSQQHSVESEVLGAYGVMLLDPKQPGSAG